jgi:chemotaxis methyl-accepting protein methylase
MDVYERTLANLLTGETRMLWAADGARDFARFADAVAALGPALSVCCIPCSTGKEVYSLVMAGLHAGLDVQALGVDRQLAYLARARSGRLVPHHRDWDWPGATTYLERDGTATTVKPLVLQRCRFVQGDVLTGQLPPERFDLVSSRNLLGYFRGSSLDTAYRNVAAQVRPGGLLLLDPFVTAAAEMAAVPRGLHEAGFVRLFPDASYYRAPL